jgi:TonB family protein
MFGHARKQMKNIVSIFVLLGFQLQAVASGVQTKPADPCTEAVIVTEDITPPVLIKRVEPDFYKDAEARKRVVGTPIIAEAVITKEGNIECAKIIRSNHPDFNKPFLEALGKWKYKPALKNGAPIAIRFTITSTIHVR